MLAHKELQVLGKEMPVKPALSALSEGGIIVLGVPFDAFSSFQRGAALAPAVIRQHLHSGMSNLCAENGVDLSADPRWTDVGDLNLDETSASISRIEEATLEILRRGRRILALGGDHSITYPLVKVQAQVYGRLSILHLDAHPDLYDEYEGNRLSHACPMARIMETGLVARMVQVGIRALNPHQRKQAERFGVELVQMSRWQPQLPISFKGPVYLTLDLDVLDPAFAPGVSHHEPGGMTTRQVLELIQRFEGDLVGADIVEFNPSRDVAGITAALASKLLKEVLVRMLAGQPANM
jgi:arginase